MKIKEHFLEGEAVDQEWVIKNRTLLEGYLFDEMREQGLVPVVDEATSYYVGYKPDTETFTYKFVAKGLPRSDAKEWYGFILADSILLGKDKSVILIVK